MFTDADYSQIIVEDEDGEVVKKYELAPQKNEKDPNTAVSQSLKYMGMGSLIKANERTKEHDGDGDSEGDDPAALTRVASRPAGMSGWIGFARATPGEPSSQRQRKKSVAAEQEEDDRHIRFTIGGVGRRMTKDGFINEMQKLDQNTRQEVVDRSSASHTVKTLAKQNPSPSTSGVSGLQDSDKAASATDVATTKIGGHGRSHTDGDSGSDAGSSHRSSSSQLETPIAPRRGRKASPSARVEAGSSAHDVPESAVERRRRLAVLRGVDDGGEGDDKDDNYKETPAERRRREAALGMSNQPGDDSDDDDTPRVPPTRRGIRFAEMPKRRQG